MQGVEGPMPQHRPERSVPARDAWTCRLGAPEACGMVRLRQGQRPRAQRGGVQCCTPPPPSWEDVAGRRAGGHTRSNHKDFLRWRDHTPHKIHHLVMPEGSKEETQDHDRCGPNSATQMVEGML